MNNKKSFHKGRIGDRFRTVEIHNDNLKKKNQKEYKKIAILVMFLLISVIGTSYGLFKVLINNANEHEVVAGTFKVEFEEGNEIHLTNLTPMSDSEGMSTEGYHFTIKNTGTIDAKYHVSLEEISASSNILDRKYINYSIKLSDGSWTSPRSLSEGLLLNSGSLSAESGKDRVDYELKMWLREDADNSVQGKTYAARIVVSAVQSNGSVDPQIAPVINLPNTSIQISLNDSFTDPVPYEIKDSLGQTIDISNIIKTYEYYDGQNTIPVEGVDTSKSGIYYIYYRVSDKNGNIGCTVVSVSVNPTSNNQIPTITLVGESNLELKKGEDYQELGATAEDAEDGVLTDRIINVGTVNSLVEGVYTIKYIIIDSKGNTNSIARVVHVIPKGSIEITTLEITKKDNKYHIPVHIVTKDGNIGGYYLSNYNKRPTTSHYTKLEEVTNQYDKEFIVSNSGDYYLWVYDTNHNVKSKKIEVKKIGDISSSEDEINLKVGQSKKIEISNNTGTLTYESSNPDIAVVDKNGVIQGTSVGTTTISVTDTATSSVIHIPVNVYKEVTITFSSNGSKLNSTTKSCEIWKDSTGCEISSPSIEREGYRILGFSQNENATDSSWDANTKKMVSEDATYYAITAKDIHIKVYYNNGGNIDSITENKTIYNQNKGSYEAPDVVVNSKGLRELPYKGISSKLNNIETKEVYTDITDNQIYYTVYSGNIDTKFYYYDNGQKTIFSKTPMNSIITSNEDTSYHLEKEEVSVPEEVLLSEGEEHRTYYGLSNRPTDYHHIESSITTENETYYAVYKGKWEISYTHDENSIKSIGSTSDQCDNYQITDGEHYTIKGDNCTKTLPEIISRDHYFDGKWYEQDTTIGNPGDEYTIGENKVLLAKAKEKKYRVKYDCTTTGGSCNIQDKTLRYGDIINLDEVAEKSGYDFLGWHTNKESLNGFTAPPTVTGDITLYAIFRKSKEISLNAKTTEYTGREVEANDADVSGVEDSSQVIYQYYSDTHCNNELSSVPIDAGNYSVKAILEESDGNTTLQTGCVAHTITPKRVNVIWEESSEFSYTGDRQAPEYEYHLDGKIEHETLEFIQSKEIDVGSYVSEVSLVSVIGGRGRIENYALDHNRKAYNIVRADGYIDLSSNGRVIEQGQNNDFFTIINSHGGTLSVEETTSSGINVSLESDEVQITGLSRLAIGTVITIRVTCAETKNYSLKTADYTITIKRPNVNLNDAVARIDEEYYASLEDALFYAKESKDTIVMLKDTTESVVNEKNITINLNGKKVTGSSDNTITNNGILTIINTGTIENTTDTAIINNGELTLGENDSEVLKDNPYISGEKKGIVQNGIMNFYDGLIRAKIGFVGNINNKPDHYVVFVNQDSEKSYQKVYLLEESLIQSKAVVKVAPEGAIETYYFNLQDGINDVTTSGENQTLYVIRDFEAAYEVSIEENSEISLDITGYTVRMGSTITNHGILNVINSNSEKGKIQTSETIMNNNQLNLDRVTIEGTTNKNIIDNRGILNIKNSNINANNGYAVHHISGRLNIDSNCSITSMSNYALYIIGSDKVIINGGHYQSNNQYAIYVDSNSILEINNINITGYSGIKNAGVTIIKTANIEVSNVVLENENNNDAILTVYDGEYQAELDTIKSYGGTFNIIDGNYNTGIVVHNRGELNLGLNDDKTKIPNITSKGENQAIRAYKTATINIYNGEINSKHAILLRDETTFNMYDGKIMAEQVGIFGDSPSWGQVPTINVYGGSIMAGNTGISTSGVTVIGKKQDQVNLDRPLIIGDNYGVYIEPNSSYAIVSFYDGILKGKIAGYYGTISTLPDEYWIKNDTEEINGMVYQTSYLEEIQKFLRVGDREYNTFQKAIDAIDTEGTVEVIAPMSIAEEILVPENKNIVIDLAGFEITNSKMMSNDGTLRILDSSTSQTGTYINTSQLSSEYAIKSTKNIILDSGTIKSTGNASTVYILGNGVVNGGNYLASNVNSDKYAFYIAPISEVQINRATITGSSGIMNNGTLNIETADMNVSQVAISNNNGTVKINEGSYTAQNYTINNISGTVNLIEGTYHGTIRSGSGLTTLGDENHSTKSPIISSDSNVAIEVYGNMDIHNASITSTTDSILIYPSATLNMYNGKVVSVNHTGVRGKSDSYSNSAINIYGGEITGGTYGVYSVGVRNQYPTVIGTKEETINNTGPIIRGEEYGLYIEQGNTVKFYSGILKGKKAGHFGIISMLPDEYGIERGTEEIENEIYSTTYLDKTQYFLKVGEEKYNTFEKALAAIDTEGTIEVIASTTIAEEILIPGNKNIVIDLAGFEITNSEMISNNGTLRILDSSTSQTGSYLNTSQSSNEYAIKSNNQLILDSGTISSIEKARGIYISGNGEINGGTYSSTSECAIYTSSNSILHINRIHITGYNGIKNFGQTIIETGNIEVSNTALFNGREYGTDNNIELTIKNGTYMGNNQVLSLEQSGLKITTNLIAGTYTGGIQIGYRAAGTLNIGNEDDLTQIPSFNSGINTNGTMVINVYNINLETANGAGIQISQQDTLNIYNGQVVSLNNNGIAGYGNSNIHIYGGKIIGNTYGLYIASGVQAVVGNEDEFIHTDAPIIMGKTYGLYINEGSNISFYDGVVKGKIDSYSGTITKLPNQYVLLSKQEIIDEESYIISYLEKAKDIVKNGDKAYSNLPLAIEEANNGDTLKIIDNGGIFDEVIIPNGKEITLDLNNHQLTMNKSIINSGDFHIMDGSTEKNGMIRTQGDIILIDNRGSLRMNDISLENIMKEKYVIYNYEGASLDAENITVTGYGVANESNFSLNHSTINGNARYSFYNSTSANDTVLLNDNTIINTNKLSEYSLYNNSKDSEATITVKGGTIGKIYHGVGIMNLQGITIDLNFDDYISSVLSIMHYSGTLNLIGSTISLNYSYTYSGYGENITGINSYEGNLSISNTTFQISAVKRNGTVTGIRRDGTSNDNIVIEDSIFNLSSNDDAYGISNYGNNTDLILRNSEINIIKSRYGRGIFHNNRNEYTLMAKLINNNINITSEDTAQGLYSSPGAQFTLESGTITLISNSGMAIGIHIIGGTVTMGIHDGDGTENAMVSTSSPLVKAIGRTGIGIKKDNGYFNFYDGRIIASTSAKPDITTDVEYNYEAVTSIDDETGYEHCILKYIK